MTVDFNKYKEQHKSKNQIELEKLTKASDEAYSEYNSYINQQQLKWKNKPEGSQASPEEVNELFSMMAMLGTACQDVKDQQIKMGLRSQIDKTEKQNKIVSFK